MAKMSPYFSILLISTVIATVTGDFSDNQIIEQVTTSDNPTSETLFTHFKKRFGKTYATKEEHDYRFTVFLDNLRQAQINQKLDPTAKHGVTKFSDMTPAEFRSKYLGLGRVEYPAPAPQAGTLPTDNLPTDFDWRNYGAVTRVQNQANCGSCWSFGAVGALEGAHFVANHQLENLSEQQLVDCDHECTSETAPRVCDNGCQGGRETNAFKYILKSGGIMRERDYRYTAKDGVCKFNGAEIAARIKNYSRVLDNEGQIAANLIQNGPLSAGINSEFAMSYEGGVSCPPTFGRIDHGVLIVGYGSSGYSSSQKQNMTYWIVKNSWGKDWGEKGYYLLCRGYNACRINQDVLTVAAVKTCIFCKE